MRQAHMSGKNIKLSKIQTESQKDAENKRKILENLGKKVSSLVNQSDMNNIEQLSFLIKKTTEQIEPFWSIIKNFQKQKSIYLDHITPTLKKLEYPIKELNEAIRISEYYKSQVTNDDYFLSPELIITKKDNSVEKLEKIEAMLEKIINEKKIINNKINHSYKQFEGAKEWNDIEIKFKNDSEIEIFINKNFIKITDYEEIGFCGKGKDKKPNALWHFLLLLSVLCQFKKEEATKQSIMMSLRSTLKLKITENRLEKIKSDLSKKLKKSFGLNSDPFYPYKDYGYYYPKFKIHPIPKLRGSGEIFEVDGEYNDNIDYKIK